MLKFILPNFYYYQSINSNLQVLYKKYKDMFQFMDITFIAECGSFPFHYYNGGPQNIVYPNVRSPFASYEVLNQEVSYHPVPLILDCSNIYLNEQDLLDTTFNQTLSIFNTYTNDVLVSSALVKNYILNNYKGYGIIASPFYKDEDIENIKRFQYYCIDTNINNLPKKSSVEIIISHGCNCPDYLQCILTQQKNQYDFKQSNPFSECNKHEGIQCLNLKNIKESFCSKGFSTFSFDLRTFPLNNLYDIIHFYCSFFIKEEYYHKAFHFLEKGEF